MHTIHPYDVCTPCATCGRSGTAQEVMSNMVSCCNVFGGYEDPVDKIHLAHKKFNLVLKASFFVNLLQIHTEQYGTPVHLSHAVQLARP